MHKMSALLLSSLGLLLALSSRAAAQTPAGPPAYRQVVTATPGTIVFVAGQIAQNEKGELVGKGDLKAQADQAWENVRGALAAGGATFKDVTAVIPR